MTTHVHITPETSPDLAALREIAWVAREANALVHLTAPDPAREAAFVARKRALLAYIDPASVPGATISSTDNERTAS